MTPEEKRQLVVEAARRDLLAFAQLVNPSYVPEPFHVRIAEALERALAAAQSGGKARLILSVPPRSGKSELASVLLPAWALGRDPKAQFILSTYGAELAEVMGRKARDVMSAPEYAACFPGVSLREDQKAKAKWLVEYRGANGETRRDGGGYTAVGVGGALTGIGARVIIVDDPFKSREEAESPRERERVWDYYRSTLYSRLEGAGAVIVIMQRWHGDDLVGRLLAEQAAKGDGPGDEWEVVNFPAIAEEDEIDPETGEIWRREGEPLWPSKFPLAVLENIRATMSEYNWQCTPSESPVLMSDWTQKPIADVLPGDEVIGFKNGVQAARAELVRATVLRVFSKRAKVFRVVTEAGDWVRCTEDHMWYNGRKEGSSSNIAKGGTYAGRKAYSKPKVGRRLMRVTDPWTRANEACPSEVNEWRYFAGLVDGEGNVARGALTIAQSHEKNGDVAARIDRSITAIGAPRRAWRRDGFGTTHFVIGDVRNVYQKMLRYGGDFGKRGRAVKALWQSPHMFIKQRDRIVEIREEGEEIVHALETTTGNYVVWGYASSNSQYQQKPIPRETQEFKPELFKVWDAAEMEKLRFAGKLRYATAVDPAISQARTADATVVLTVAKEIGGPRIFRVREDAGRYTPSQTVDLIFSHQLEFGSDVGIECVAYQRALKYAVTEEQRRKERYFPVVELKATGDKATRIRGLLPLYAAGVISHMPGDRAYEAEALQFPNGKHDDRLDAMAHTLQMVGNTSYARAKTVRSKIGGFRTRR